MPFVLPNQLRQSMKATLTIKTYAKIEQDIRWLSVISELSQKLPVECQSLVFVHSPVFVQLQHCVGKYIR